MKSKCEKQMLRVITFADAKEKALQEILTPSR
jgi:hypothetical protein